jgi:hypothetical protein
MTNRAEIAAQADGAVNGWLILDRVPGTVHKLESAGYLVDVGEAYPRWCHDMGEVRRVLAELDLLIGS